MVIIKHAKFVEYYTRDHELYSELHRNSERFTAKEFEDFLLARLDNSV